MTRFENEQLSPIALHFLTDYFQLQYEDFKNHSAMYTEKERKALLYMEAASLHDEMNKEKQNVLCLWCTDIINFRSEGLNVETIQTIFVECCCENRKCLSPGSLLSKIIDTPLWLCIASKKLDNNLPQIVYSMDWSENVAYFIHNDTTGSIENNAFRILTNDTFIPNIHPTAAIILLNEERTRGLHDLPIQEIPVTEAMMTTAKTTEDEDYDEIDDHTVNKKDDDDTMLSNLQERCIDSFDSANLEQESNENLREKVLNVMSHTVLKAYLRKNLVRTRQTIAAKNNTINQAKNQFISEREKNERQLQDKNDLIVRMRPLKQFLRKSIMDIIVRHQNSCAVTLDRCAGMLPDIPKTEIEREIEILIKEDIEISRIDLDPAECYEITDRNIINDRAYDILERFKTNTGDMLDEKLTKEDCYKALFYFSKSHKDTTRILDELQGCGRISTDYYKPNQYTIH